MELRKYALRNRLTDRGKEEYSRIDGEAEKTIRHQQEVIESLEAQVKRFSSPGNNTTHKDCESNQSSHEETAQLIIRAFKDLQVREQSLKKREQLLTEREESLERAAEKAKSYIYNMSEELQKERESKSQIESELASANAKLSEVQRLFKDKMDFSQLFDKMELSEESAAKKNGNGNGKGNGIGNFFHVQTPYVTQDQFQQLVSSLDILSQEIQYIRKKLDSLQIPEETLSFSHRRE